MSHGLQMETWRRAPLGHWLLGLGLLLLVSLGLTLWLGPVRLGWPGHLDPLAEQILWQIRWPRAWMAILLGAGLASSGCILQTLLHNRIIPVINENDAVAIAKSRSVITTTCLRGPRFWRMRIC